jgi:hypothetical protein
MYQFSDIRQLHIELTNLCNAACPSCARNDRGGATLPWLPQSQIRLSTFKIFFPAEVFIQIRKVVFCGSYGDPSMAQDLLDICSYVIKSNPEIIIELNTNGGTRSQQWWAQLAKIIGPRSKVIFSIDGLQDSNHIYRRGVNWDKLMQNVTSYINAGGVAAWDFLIFRHNQHQLNEAKLLSKRLGFSEFAAKRALGFDLATAGHQSAMTVLKDDGSFDYNIYPPSAEQQLIDEEKMNFNAVFKIKKIARDAKDEYTREFVDLASLVIDKEFEKKAAGCRIDCHAKKYFEIYISAEGMVFPCCFMGSQYYLAGKYHFEKKQTQQFFDSIGAENHSLHYHSLKDIVESTWFQKTIPASWELASIREGKLSVCSSYCGKEFNKLDTITYNRSSEG